MSYFGDPIAVEMAGRRASAARGLAKMGERAVRRGLPAFDDANAQGRWARCFVGRAYGRLRFVLAQRWSSYPVTVLVQRRCGLTFNELMDLTGLFDTHPGTLRDLIAEYLEEAPRAEPASRTREAVPV